ncbi:hypothetical protein HMPREF1411_01615 [Helicobacter pylori GAM250AFi]|nr:hypothetical protein HMPREF1411_01615 [Helicobacter pylori GAM250AFi]EMH12755.1 hypothetical protein HMPREF1414_01503 [Helicobacter pylori GAM252T]EMH12761.1 hypothetical protein HMPREF1413_01371 [Helicobacter pylori GAM252Bi]EMH13115.1 hypothetical protein HMPREF1412_01209 [Helicobacter pylori GAM250T]EMH46534.1 hypothetical protein HMPREF1438_01314 [Helicobacter pylori HP250AFii]EMH46914.1 hypothetical protein HMPREF1439_01317 [Helicobacter pylori HP250AFiii]EMH50252.1 hypothetical prote
MRLKKTLTKNKRFKKNSDDTKAHKKERTIKIKAITTISFEAINDRVKRIFALSNVTIPTHSQLSKTTGSEWR